MIKEEKPPAFQNNNKFKDILEEYHPQSFIIHHSSLITHSIVIKNYHNELFL